MELQMLLERINLYVFGWPLLIFVIGVGLICTLATRFIQIRYFSAMWKYTFGKSDAQNNSSTASDMTPLQAFINTLSTNLGNGSIAGMATALYSGGPGSAIWVVIIGLILMAVRYAEVFLSTYSAAHATHTNVRIGGPMLYLRRIPGGVYIAQLYALLCLIFGLIGGNAIQTNSISLSLNSTWAVPLWVCACLVFVFMLYVMFGGAARVVKVSDKLVPVKVILFFVSTFIVLAYHYQAIVPALKLMIHAAFSSRAVLGGIIGFSVQQAMRFGIFRSIMATESGLGTAAILFGSTGSTRPVKDGVMSMLSTFISTIVCFIVALCIVVSGVWNSGLTSTPLTIAAFNTVFGEWGGWLVSFLSVTFGAGVLVSYGYITREAWLSVTGGRGALLFTILYCVVAFLGALVKVDVVWASVDLVNAAMLIINLLGIVYLLPLIISQLGLFERKTN
ncbi:sodium:alanine symporter family protein [Vermiphilus pyriformis]|nr:MAG: sodium:alanine symporter family protein [Vermiphilus pyriformis]